MNQLCIAAALGLTVCTSAVAADCDPFASAASAPLRAVIQVKRDARVTRAFQVRVGAALLLLARERGVDVTLEVLDPDGRRIGRADNPVRRTGTQRIAFTSRATHYTAVLKGKERGSPGGLIELLLIEAPAEADACGRAQSLLALADAAYAEGQAVSSGQSADAHTSATAYYTSAAESYVRGATQGQQSGALILAAQAALASAAVKYQDLQDWQAAYESADQAASLHARIGDSYGRARAQALEAAALMELNERPELPKPLGRARELLHAIAAFHAARGERYDEALALNNIGLSYYLEDSFRRAISCYQRARPLFEQLHESFRTAVTLQNIALSEYYLGHYRNSLREYARALKGISRSDNPKWFALITNNRALVNWISGNPDAALRDYTEALGAARDSQDLSQQAESLHGMAAVYDKMGDPDLALQLYRQALALRTVERDPRGRLDSLRSMANVLRGQDHADEALRMHTEAFALADTAATRMRIELQLARDYEALGKRAEAMRRVEALLRSTAHADDAALRARVFLESSRLWSSQGDLPRAESAARRGLEVVRNADAPIDEFQLCLALADIRRASGDVTGALSLLDRALRLAESVRLESANPELRATLLQPLRPAFDAKISILAEQYFAAANAQRQRELALRALLTAERARARALADFRALNASGTGIPPQLAEARESAYRELAAQRSQLASTVEQSGYHSQRAAALRAEIALSRERSHDLDAQLAALSPHREQLPEEPMDLASLPEDTAVIEYWLGSEQALAWVLTRNAVALHRLGSSASLNSAALAYHAALEGFGSVSQARRAVLGAQLSALILEPMEPAVSGKRTLIFAADGALHYIPFAALPMTADPANRVVASSHDTAVTPSVEMLLNRAAPRSSGPGRSMLLVFDPVYGPDDERFGPRAARTRAAPPTLTPAVAMRGASQAQQLPRLPATRAEAEAIAELVHGEGVDRLQGLDANREQFLGAQLGRYQFIHVASHAVADSEIPQLSALILSTFDAQRRPIEGRVFAADLLRTRLTASTVVLSGCETALGKSMLGEGLIGLQYIMLARGARSVVSSLWQVPDQSTAQLMKDFYGQLLDARASTAAALAAAVRKRLQRPNADPALWAAFTVAVSDLPSNSTNLPRE